MVAAVYWKIRSFPLHKLQYFAELVFKNCEKVRIVIRKFKKAIEIL